MKFEAFIYRHTNNGKIGFLMTSDYSGELCYYVGACHGLNDTIDMHQVYNAGVEIPPEAGMVIFFGEWGA